ncbi:hypothetical protein CBS147343_6137 [Aspergillus niger]|nr:hypothetical protein CBS133816_1220 [Aspergillus niger]KAI2839437.1 hypothetical protein CBS11350_7503 [Aspergillus niger]KAI2943296.1 hypothetical protein CBS147321_4818 [Aspergillus niger]KAI2990283.1 hypothetical protein CBS147482_9173 [Aspergillus niger]KAI3069669.1 hypothetical protein CBS147343_6137 [Aspergillus niger]
MRGSSGSGGSAADIGQEADWPGRLAKCRSASRLSLILPPFFFSLFSRLPLLASLILLHSLPVFAKAVPDLLSATSDSPRAIFNNFNLSVVKSSYFVASKGAVHASEGLQCLFFL